MTTPQQQVIDKCKEVVEKAKALYGIDMSHVKISFDLRGRCAGTASIRYGQYMVKFNRDMLTREAFDHVLNNTVPHEYAHIACFMKRSLGSNHDRGWATVCKALGGAGARYHSEEVVYGKGSTYEYITTLGHKVRVGERHHKYVQGGMPLTFKRGKGRIDATCAYSIVGHRGVTLANPIVKKPANHPANIEIAVRAAPTFFIGAPEVPKPTPVFDKGASKASIARSIMLAGKTRGLAHEEIITAIMSATGHDRQLARATFKANAAKVGITL